MATQTAHYHLIKPESADRVAIGNINDNSDTIDGYLYKANERADQLADDYNPSLIYNTDDYVRRENYLYKCNTDNTTGTWDATKWDRVKVMDEITQGGGGGGSSTLAGLNDVSVSGIANKDIIRYNSTTRKYEKSSDLTDLELSVSQLSSSVLSIAGDVDTLELTVSQMSASTLPYDANISTKQKIDNVESSIPTSASDLPYSSTQSTKQKIDEVESEIPTNTNQLTNGAGFITGSNVEVGTIGAGEYIRDKLTNTNIPVGVSFWFTQVAEDSPDKGNVGVTMIAKATLGGAYSRIYSFTGTSIYNSFIGNTVPSQLSWTRITS